MKLSQASNWLQSLSDSVRHFRLSHLSPGRTHGMLGTHVILLDAITGTATLACAICLVFAILQHRRRQTLADQLERIQALMAQVKMTGRLEENLNKMLFMLGKIIQAPYYAFYVWDVRSDKFILRSVSHPYDLFEGVGPAYSGLALPKREAYLPPRILEKPADPRVVFIQHDGDVPMFCLRIGDGRGVIRIGPVERIPRRISNQLRDLGELFGPVLEDLLDFEMYQMEHSVRAMADAAINKVASLATNVYATVELMLHAFIGVSGGIGGAFVETKSRGRCRVYVDHADTAWGSALQSDEQAISRLDSLTRRNGQHLLFRHDAEFYELPESITSLEDVGAVVLCRLSGIGLLVLLFNSTYSHEQYPSIGRQQIRYLSNQIVSILDQAGAQEHMAKVHTRVLSQMADVIDNLNPYTVGYSAMLMRYSLAVGKKLGLSDNELHDLALAARLSNVGLIGMDIGLLYKEGKYTDYEYNLMKFHCEIGAAMIETVTGNRQASAFVLHHHERVDGNGYPNGIAGEGIPMGAKILHAVQLFLAKVNGRAWRPPLPFERAIEQLERSVGTSLDPDVVTALIEWLHETGRKPERRGRSLGACHEMCCVPKAICESCPAFQQPVHCWEVSDNHCKAHGRTCNDCFVRTEYFHRVESTVQVE